MGGFQPGVGVLTRLRALMLIQSEVEVCVCELTFALDESQPKISRHLALMREDADVVVTVCGHADEQCPVLPPKVEKSC